ncbi:MAG: C39 family peptidase [Eubacteriales bacterium]|nr:C39 family peptidase [Eubacteriales bacterium]
MSPTAVYAPVPEVRQEPELPTGCESVALTIVLKSLGYDLEKTTVADNYLARGDNMAIAYCGNPYSYAGAGAFPPAIVKAANKFLREKESSKRAYNISGASLEDLYDYIRDGYPIILWHTTFMGSTFQTGGSYPYRGMTYSWYANEHCLVLYGYDKAKNTVLLSDPMAGLVERDADAFQQIYDTIGKYAVVIK